MKFPDLRIYGAGAVQPDPGWHIAPHFHSFHEIIVVVRGRLLLKSDRPELTARPGDVLFYRSGFVHEETSDPKSPVSTLFLAFDTGDPLPWLPLRVHDAQGRVRHLVAWLVDDERNRRAPEMRRPLFDALLSELRRLCNAPRDPWLEGILAFIQKNLTRPLTIDDLARHGKMSKFAFVRKFKRLCGRTPMAELRLSRLDQARTLLLTTNLPLKAVAPAVGIGDEYQLSKLFRSHFNLSPRDLRTHKVPVALPT
ncbi:MAG: AraC family transcriptional regulator [Methylacidiphilales bacterium]|nr:AraC family transcriptional regulator [Candidatus Methylacidiphilales bacterium]